MDPPVYSYSSPGSPPFTGGAPSALLGALQGSVGPCIQTSENFSSSCRVDAFAPEIPQRPEEELWTRVSLVFPLVISGVFDSPLAWRVCGWW